MKPQAGGRSAAEVLQGTYVPSEIYCVISMCRATCGPEGDRDDSNDSQV